MLKYVLVIVALGFSMSAQARVGFYCGSHELILWVKTGVAPTGNRIFKAPLLSYLTVKNKDLARTASVQILESSSNLQVKIDTDGNGRFDLIVDAVYTGKDQERGGSVYHGSAKNLKNNNILERITCGDSM